MGEERDTRAWDEMKRCGDREEDDLCSECSGEEERSTEQCAK